ncbi:ricin-type beta-trefoil lectin domain protein [Micromonospora profundi]|uniref:ricin-type beta-trefoil lectin domain protein n=1 Tax=Micromonospora profundi TaxID=1420889 RepID=UPI002FEFE358
MESDQPSPLRRLGPISRRAAAGVVAGLAVLSAVVATVSWGVASAQDDDFVGRAVTDEQLTTIRSAARSCPALTPARLAGQLMAESGLDGRARKTASGGRGIAGLDDAAWEAWVPWPGARRSDSAANILALAHKMCDLSGQVRVTKIDGDPWRLSLAAFNAGIDEVRKAKGVPSSAVDYVDHASGYAAFYADLVPFGGAGEPQPNNKPQQPRAVPEGYVPLVVRAGAACPEVPPAAVAGQVMALSGFDPNMLGDEGQRGIAQFLPEVWQEHGPARGSVWDPQVAVPAVGTVMCALRNELSGIEGDPYLLALAAFRNGPTTVRQTGGEFDGPTQVFLRTVRENTEFYAIDSRLKPTAPTKPVVPPKPGGSPSLSPSPTATAANPRPPVPPAQPERPDEPTKAPAPPVRPAGAKQIVGKETGLCLSGGEGDGVRATVRKCQEVRNQWWSFSSDGTIRANGLCLDVAWGEKRDGAPVQSAHCTAVPAQKWEWIESNGRRSLFNRATDKCLDVDGHAPGAPMMIWICVFNPKQTFSQR